jgi:hypothetical protein
MTTLLSPPFDAVEVTLKQTTNNRQSVHFEQDKTPLERNVHQRRERETKQEDVPENKAYGAKQ